jgi:predicted GNAT family N-acyltransferase
MFRIELLDWHGARVLATPIRIAVFVEEQGVPAEIEMDDMDGECVHAIALEEGRAVGTARLLPDGHIGRMAVLKEWRSRGIGSLLLHSLVQKARERGDRQVVLSAQVHAVPFYRAHGFRAEGPVYEEAGIPHQGMRRAL